MKRTDQLLLIGTFLPLCWLLMQAVHELGHVAATVATGGTVARAVVVVGWAPPTAELLTAMDSYENPPAHSYRRASIGSSREAFQAG